MVNTLPKIVRFLETVDCLGALCPHCGAPGRWIHRFIVEDGRTLGAMSGCVKLFPQSPVVREAIRLRKKADDYEKRGWKLNQNDSRALDAIEAYENGQATEQMTLSAVKSAKSANSARFRGRR